MTPWAFVPGHSRYVISDVGRVVSLVGVKPRILESWPTHRGYRRITLSSDELVPVTRFLHDLVLEAFVGPCPAGHECRHLNGDPSDNRLVNLAWGTRSENAIDRVTHGTNREANKTHCKWGHEFSPENTYRFMNKKTGRENRQCIACRTRRYEQRKQRV